VEEFRYNIGAEDRVARARVADQQDPEYRGFFDVGALGIANAYGVRAGELGQLRDRQRDLS
jgi:hypothetical protein